MDFSSIEMDIVASESSTAYKSFRKAAFDFWVESQTGFNCRLLTRCVRCKRSSFALAAKQMGI